MLRYGDYTLSDDLITKITAVARHYDLVPSFVICQLCHETAWGQHPNSISAREDNNWGGMTWGYDDLNPKTRKSGVQVIPGRKRPAVEGGYYIHYATVEDFLKDYGYLLRNGGFYKTSGAKTLWDYARGLFRLGGAQYDYAGDGSNSEKVFNSYFNSMKTIHDALNADGSLDRIDKGESSNMAGLQSLLSISRSYVDEQMYGSGHRRIVDTYNGQNPLPVGYKLKIDDDWCAAFVTAMSILSGNYALTGGECGVERFVQNEFQPKGIWLGKVRPQAGDIIIFDWDANRWADHIGYVESVSGDTVYTIEGNSGSPSAVRRQSYTWNMWQIKGYARPKWGDASPAPLSSGGKSIDAIAQEVLTGAWGNGDDRRNRLTAAGYDYTEVQAKINAILNGDSAPARKEGWNQDDTGWWYVVDGEYLKSEWRKIDDYWYLFDRHGYAYCNSWGLDGDKWYYFDENCHMVTGWIKYRDKWYHLEDEGEMSSKEYVKGFDGRLYYVTEEGSMLESTDIEVREDGSLVEKETGNIVGTF